MWCWFGYGNRFASIPSKSIESWQHKPKEINLSNVKQVETGISYSIILKGFIRWDSRFLT